LTNRKTINGSYTVEKVEAAVTEYEKYLFENQEKLEIESVYSYFQNDYAMSTILLVKGPGTKKSTEDIKEEIKEGLPKLAIANPSFTWRNQGGGGTSIRVQLTGKSSERLSELSRDVAWSLSQIPGFSDVRSEAEIGEKEVQIVVDRQRARQYGFTTREIADRETLDQLKNLPLHARNGRTVKLASLANFQIRRGPRNISRENRTTSLGVTANLTDVTKGDAQKLISSVLGKYNFPAGYSWNFGESFDNEQEALQTMLINLLLALVLIYFVMASLFESILFPTAIWTQILFSIVGVYWFYLFTGTKMSIMGMIGILILIGVVVNNGIVLVDHINHLRSRGLNRHDAIVQAGRDRLRPILMTAGTTVLSLVPLCIVTTEIGGNGPPYYPMARAIVGGLTFSTVITLLVLPTIYSLLDDLRNWSRRVIAKAKGVQSASPTEHERRLSV
jgi:HAE1 family hydrophobic/amphiphilic exporter-1